MDTIFALASAHGRAGVSVVRVSGPDAHALARELCGDLPKERVATVRALRDPLGEPIDQALVLRFDAPRSFTGEDVIEFQTHGSLAVVKALLEFLTDTGQARLAEPGEFTRRALENEKLDLTQVEGLADLIVAETEAQRKQALRVLSGEMGDRVDHWRSDLIRAASLLEATIDFADEEVPVDVTPEVSALLDRVSLSLDRELERTAVAERIRLGFEVAIVGSPNAGKSTLLNRLAGREAAITSEVAGTTRDVIEVRMDLKGLPVTLLDTAGLRESEDQIESIGIERARARAARADLRVYLRMPDEEPPLELQADDILVQAKADLLACETGGVSGKTGFGVDELIARIGEVLSQRASISGLATHERHRVAIIGAMSDLVAAQEQLRLGPEMYDIAAEELRSAIRSLEALVGRIDVENVLDEVFSSFCLGK